MSTRPAEILGLAKGQLEPGYDADFVLVDLDTPYTVDKEKLHSKSHNCPFDGAQLYGRVYATIKGGRLRSNALRPSPSSLARCHLSRRERQLRLTASCC